MADSTEQKYGDTPEPPCFNCVGMPDDTMCPRCGKNMPKIVGAQGLATIGLLGQMWREQHGLD